jgi:transcriptional regulator with XRE-family HTH domain
MNISLANKLSALRRESSLTENELAVFIGISDEKIKQWETAELEPTASELFELSKLYHVSIDELIKPDTVSSSSKTITLEKSGPEAFIRERRPDNYTETEIYPNGHNLRFVSTNDPHFQSAPYTKAEEIKPRDLGFTTYAEPEQANIRVETVKSGSANTANNINNSNANTADINNIGNKIGSGIDDLIGKIPPDTAAKISGALNKAGAVIGDTIDKFGEEIKRSANGTATQKSSAKADGSYNYQYSYNTPPPASYGALSPKQERERAKWQKKEEKWRRKAERQAQKQHRSLFYKLFPLLMTTLYFMFGLWGDIWARSLIIFLLVPIYYSLVEAIESHDFRKFAYPIAVTFMYVLGGFLVGNWVGGLMLFLTIPFYYVFADHLRQKSNETAPENDIYPQ